MNIYSFPTDTFGYWQINNHLLNIGNKFCTRQIAFLLLKKHQHYLKYCLEYEQSLNFNDLTSVKIKERLFTDKSYVEYIASNLTTIKPNWLVKRFVIDNFEYFSNILITVNDFEKCLTNSIFLTNLLAVIASYCSGFKSDERINKPMMQIFIQEIKKHQNLLMPDAHYLDQTVHFAQKIGLTDLVEQCKNARHQLLTNIIDQSISRFEY